MSTPNGYTKIVQAQEKHMSGLNNADQMLDTARAAKPEGKYARRQHQEDVASILRDAAGHAHGIDVLQRAVKGLSPAALEVFATGLGHDDLQGALAAIPSNHRGGPVGDFLREVHAPAGPLGHKVPANMQSAFDAAEDEALHGLRMGSDAKGASGTSTGDPKDGGVASRADAAKVTHQAPAPKKQMSFRDASEAIRQAFKTGDDK